MTDSDINWAIIEWAQSPLTRDPCKGTIRRKAGTQKLSMECDSTHCRDTSQGSYCLRCWDKLIDCDLCQHTKGLHKYHNLNLCPSCYNDEFSQEYLARSAYITLNGDGPGAQMEEVASTRKNHFRLTRAFHDKLKESMKRLGIPSAESILKAPFEVAASGKETRARQAEKLAKLRGDK